MIRLPPRATLTDTLFPDTTLSGSQAAPLCLPRHGAAGDREAAGRPQGLRPAGRGLRARLDRGDGEEVPAPRPHLLQGAAADRQGAGARDPGDPSRRSEEHTSELQSLMRISYAVVCLTQKTKRKSD